MSCSTGLGGSNQTVRSNATEINVIPGTALYGPVLVSLNTGVAEWEEAR
jgi:hypothetical protein